MKTYELIEHTADVGIRVKGKTLKDLFKNSARVMFGIIVESKAQTPKKEIKIIQKAGDLEELLVNWLNELLSLSATKELIFCDFKIKKINENSLEAVAIGNPMKDYKVNVEIKAATYHGLAVKKTIAGWQAEIIFDV